MIIEAEGLGYTYPGQPDPVIRSLDFQIEAGEVFGFLGPNGSGKTTTQKLLTRILPGYRGKVSIFGQDLRGQSAAFYNRVGVCFEFPNLYEKLTAEENLGFYAEFFDVATEEPRNVLERLDLPVGDRRPVSKWSKGMKMRLSLGRSLLNRPPLWFLDEPTTGQDPAHAVLIRQLIREKAELGTSIFLTTHNMTVADELCDRVAFLVDGEIRVLDAPRDLKLAHRSQLARVEYRNDSERVTRDFDLATQAEKNAFAELVRTREIETIHTQEPTLEDVFLRVTGRDLA